MKATLPINNDLKMTGHFMLEQEPASFGAALQQPEEEASVIVRKEMRMLPHTSFVSQTKQVEGRTSECGTVIEVFRPGS